MRLKKSPYNKFLELLVSNKRIMVIYTTLSVILSILLLVGMPYEKTIILYFMIFALFGTYILTVVLLVPPGVFFKIIGKTFPQPISVLISNIINTLDIILKIGFIPTIIIIGAYFISLFKVSWVLFLLFIGISLFLINNIRNNNRIISKETDINVIQSIRSEWSRKRIKWVILLFILLTSLLILGIREHISFSIIDCSAMSIYILFVAYYAYISPYRNTYSKEYSNKNFVFFLRSFQIDDSVEDNIISAINSGLSYTAKNKLRILRIGNPSLTMYDAAFGADTFFLPTNDWQPVVRKYISEAKAVVVLINVPKTEDNSESSQAKFTQGVIWELYNNLEHRRKFIYCIEKISTHTSSGYLELLDDEKKDTLLTNCIVSILDYAQTTAFTDDRCIFTYDGEKCLLFNKIESAVKYTLGQNLNFDEIFEEYLLCKM